MTKVNRWMCCFSGFDRNIIYVQCEVSSQSRSSLAKGFGWILSFWYFLYFEIAALQLQHGSCNHQKLCNVSKVSSGSSHITVVSESALIIDLKISCDHPIPFNVPGNPHCGAQGQGSSAVGVIGSCLQWYSSSGCTSSPVATIYQV